ncbi:MAG: hypothetical protein LBQ34_04945 [Alphaproteobacteria bacterium]|jgi:hypothetical protein|nr:hypothetical protein [Alphaproteobacteria bacterium]
MEIIHSLLGFIHLYSLTSFIGLAFAIFVLANKPQGKIFYTVCILALLISLLYLVIVYAYIVSVVFSYSVETFFYGINYLIEVLNNPFKQTKLIFVIVCLLSILNCLALGAVALFVKNSFTKNALALLFIALSLVVFVLGFNSALAHAPTTADSPLFLIMMLIYLMLDFLSLILVLYLLLAKKRNILFFFLLGLSVFTAIRMPSWWQSVLFGSFVLVNILLQIKSLEKTKFLLNLKYTFGGASLVATALAFLSSFLYLAFRLI